MAGVDRYSVLGVLPDAEDCRHVGGRARLALDQQLSTALLGEASMFMNQRPARAGGEFPLRRPSR